MKEITAPPRVKTAGSAAERDGPGSLGADDEDNGMKDPSSTFDIFLIERINTD